MSVYFCVDFVCWGGVHVKRCVTRGVSRQKVKWRYVGGRGVKMSIFSVTYLLNGPLSKKGRGALTPFWAVQRA